MGTSTKYNRYAARIPKGTGLGWGGGEGGSLSFDVWGRGGLAQFGPIRTDRKSGEGECENWTFFMDVINVRSLSLISGHGTDPIL